MGSQSITSNLELRAYKEHMHSERGGILALHAVASVVENDLRKGHSLYLYHVSRVCHFSEVWELPYSMYFKILPKLYKVILQGKTFRRLFSRMFPLKMTLPDSFSPSFPPSSFSTPNLGFARRTKAEGMRKRGREERGATT